MMNASPEANHEQDQLNLERYIALAKELSCKNEKLPFPGIEEESHNQLIASDEEYPGLTTPTDQIIARMRAEGIKVVFGKHPESGNVFVLPFLSDDIENDSLSPHHLKIVDDMDDSLKALISASKARQKRSIYETSSEMTEISSMANLAEKLGCELSENGGWYRVYTRKDGSFSISKNGIKEELDGFISLVSVDDKYPPKGERISVEVRVGDALSIWKKETLLSNRDKNPEIPLDIPVNELGSFEKSSLKGGGYRQIFEYINRLKGKGFFTDQLNLIEDQMRKGQEMIDNVVIPAVRTSLPELISSEDSFTKKGGVYFWGLPKKGSKTIRGIRLDVRPGVVEVSVGRIKILPSGEVDSNYFHQKEYTIAPPLDTFLDGNVHSGWHFIEGDEKDAERALNEALVEVRKSGEI